MNPGDGRPTFYFIGVSTAGSSIRSIFPQWMLNLGQDAVLEGIDIPIGSESRVFRQAVATIQANPNALGALVTTHKIDVFRACADLFDELDPLASMLGEVSCITKRDGRLIGSAKDPKAASAAMDKFIMPGHWERHRADLLCLGAGGAGLAISYVAITRQPEADRPARIIMADIDTGRLETLGHQHDRCKPAMPVHYHRVRTAEDNDALLSTLRPYSLVVNATGLGKDQPGSPLSDNAVFPDRSLIWELNYRGERQFLDQANRHAEERSLRIEDGWQYFIHGWSSVIAEVFDIAIDDQKLAELAEIAGR